MEFISWLISSLTQWYVWIPLVSILSLLTWRNYQRIDRPSDIEGVLLALDIPKTNDKDEQSAEQLFVGLRGILRDQKELRQTKGLQEHIGFEIASVGGQVKFYIWTPKALQNFVESQIYANYPATKIYLASEDYTTHEYQHDIIYSAGLATTDNEFLPIKTYQELEVDPLVGISNTLADLAAEEEVWLQILARPIHDDGWHFFANKWISGTGSGQQQLLNIGGGLQWLGGLLSALWKPPEQGSGGAVKTTSLSERDKSRIAGVEKKASKSGYQIKIRLAYLGNSQAKAKIRLQSMANIFKQFNNPSLNSFKMSKGNLGKEYLEKYRLRAFSTDGFILNTEELASIFHLPHSKTEDQNVAWASAETAEPPAKLPIITGDHTVDEHISAFGVANYQDLNHQFGILRGDRSRHIYIIGQTGSGKTGLLELLALSDIFHGHGYAIIDPHGDFAMDNMHFIPGSRMADVVFFNPADTNYPIGFNPLEITDPSQKSNISSEVIGVLKRMFGDSWGPRLEYILRYTILALLDRPQTTMLDITRMLTDQQFRKDTLSYCKDTVVLQFWNVEFASWNDRFATEAVSPVLNKVGAFTANPIIRNIIGQPKSTFNIRQLMDEGKILIVNLSKGLIGEDNASILGAFMVTKIQLAAMSRSDIPNINDRRPFYLYVDEFQNFATDSFATILSEARKYGLNLTVANQYISQMTNNVRDAVFGNVGTFISFRVSANDAPILAKQFEPNFEASDLLQMSNRDFAISMVIDGEKVPAFAAKSLDLPPVQADNTSRIIEQSRRQYSRDKQTVEREISEAIQPVKPKTSASDHQSTTPTAPLVAPRSFLQAIDHRPTQTTTTEQGTTQASETPPKKKRTRSRRKKAIIQPSKNTNSPTITTSDLTSELNKASEHEVKLEAKPKSTLRSTKPSDPTELKIER